jgi:hypothetical protein
MMNYNVKSPPSPSFADIQPVNPLSLSAVRCAATLNLEGGNWLAEGDLNRAYSSFKSALEVLSHAELTLLLRLPSSVYAMAPTPSMQYQEHAEDHQQFLPAAHQQQQIFPSKKLQIYATLAQQTDEILRRNPLSFDSKPHHWSSPSSSTRTCSAQPRIDTTFFVYSEPFLFHPPTSPVTTQCMGLYKAQILFNLAIVFHQGGHAVDESSVFRALRLYDLCLECTISLTDSQELDSLIVTIAALNNKAQIFHEFCETKSLVVVLDTIHMAMVFLPKGVEFMETANLQGILFNVYMLRDLHCARAA